MAIGWKMLFADMLVTFAVAVGLTLLRVEVSTKDKLVVLLSGAEGKGWVDGFPDVSRVVWTVCDKHTSQ